MPALTAISIGSFDGVHRGHAALIQSAQTAVGPNGRVIAMAFDPHPLTLLNPAAAPARLTTFAQRERFLLEAGTHEVVRLHPTRELLGLSPVAFITSLVHDRHPVALVEGPDFRFGKGRAGDTQVLAQLGQDLGFATIILNPVEAVLSDHSAVKCSSTLARWLVQNGRVGDLIALLGRPYELEGQVVTGDRRGRTIGFPTANLQTDQLLPTDGVYAGVAILPSGQTFPAAVNIGQRPTFAGTEPRVEAHLIQPAPATTWSSLPGVPEYNWPLRLQLHTHLRDQFKFASIDALRAQLARDCQRTVEIVARHTTAHHPAPHVSVPSTPSAPSAHGVAVA